MNSPFEARVRACIVPMAISLSLLGACNEVTGVDLSWSLERFDGRRVENCAEARVGKIRLFWGDTLDTSEAWPCEDRNAVTRKDVPPGDALLRVVPECIGVGVAADENAFEAPAPIAREIVRGQVVTLNTILIMVQAECINGGPPCLCMGATASLVPTEAHTAP
jgi:hypothetical protein